MMEEQKSGFQARVERINARAEETSKRRPQRVRGPSLLRRLAYPMGLVGAFLLGIGAIFLSRYVQLQMVGIPGDTKGNTQDIVGLALAGGAVFLISNMLKGGQKEFASASTLAMLLTTFTYHNAVWAYPETFEQVYGRDWVKAVQDKTPASSIRFFNNVIELD